MTLVFGGISWDYLLCSFLLAFYVYGGGCLLVSLKLDYGYLAGSFRAWRLVISLDEKIGKLWIWEFETRRLSIGIGNSLRIVLSVYDEISMSGTDLRLN